MEYLGAIGHLLNLAYQSTTLPSAWRVNRGANRGVRLSFRVEYCREELWSKQRTLVMYQGGEGLGRSTGDIPGRRMSKTQVWKQELAEDKASRSSVEWSQEGLH